MLIYNCITFFQYNIEKPENSEDEDDDDDDFGGPRKAESDDPAERKKSY